MNNLYLIVVFFIFVQNVFGATDSIPDYVCKLDYSFDKSKICESKVDAGFDSLSKINLSRLALANETNVDNNLNIPIQKQEEKKIAEQIVSLSISQRAKYLSNLEKIVLKLKKIDKENLKDAFEKIKNEIEVAAKKRNLSIDAIKKMKATEIFDFSNLNEKNNKQITRSCGDDGLTQQALFIEMEEKNYILICPGEILRAANVSKNPIVLLSFFIGHELGHSLDISKIGIESYKEFLLCLSENYQAEIKGNIEYADRLERLKRSSSTPTFLDLVEKQSWIRYYDGVQAGISRNNAKFDFNGIDIFKNNLYSYELTADIFGFIALASQLKKYSISEAESIIRDFLIYRQCETEFFSLTHPRASIRNKIGFRTKQIQTIFKCNVNSIEKSSCDW